MPEPTLTERVEILERKMETLEGLPERVGAVELLVGQLRTEMHEQFSAVRHEFRTVIRTEIDAVQTGLRREIRSACDAVHTELRAEIKAEGDLIRRELRAEIREGDEETRRYMRVLHEEVLSRIAALQEGLPRRRKH
jgi:hypothetical protein